MNCTDIQAHLSWSDADSKASPEEMEGHLVTCSTCRDAFPEALPFLLERCRTSGLSPQLPKLDLTRHRTGNFSSPRVVSRWAGIAASVAASVLLALAVTRPWRSSGSGSSSEDTTALATQENEAAADASPSLSEAVLHIPSSFSHSVITYHQDRRTVHSLGQRTQSHHSLLESQR
ncbi:MAG TPA: hypothetical protein PKA37_10330 [Planctomycetota bacterium]|jgi:hypothetical protein|nr:hypothetical protein [Planctomycetota bacterium]